MIVLYHVIAIGIERITFYRRRRGEGKYATLVCYNERIKTTQNYREVRCKIKELDALACRVEIEETRAVPLHLDVSTLQLRTSCERLCEVSSTSSKFGKR